MFCRGFQHGLVSEDRGHELALKPMVGPRTLSWEETAREMAASGEDWSEWESTLADGLDRILWDGPIPPVTPSSVRKTVSRKE